MFLSSRVGSVSVLNMSVCEVSFKLPTTMLGLRCDDLDELIK